MFSVKTFLKRCIRKISKHGYSNGILTKYSLTQEKKINIYGYFDYIFSISCNSRDFLDINSFILEQASITPLRLVGKSICKNNYLLNYYSLPNESAKVNLWFVNFDFINDCYRRHRKWFNNRYNIAVFWWEFDDYFTNTKCFKFLDEVLVFSSVTYSALQKVIPPHVKLTRLEYPFIIKQPKLSRQEIFSEYGLDINLMYVLFVFDIHSYIERKNPNGVLQVFYRAWQQNKDLRLVLKITNFELWRKECQQLLTSIEDLGLKQYVTIIPDNLTDDQMRELIGACDIYISLHRAEGLGLGMLEAMSMGKPVIATRFGGNLDFMNDDNSLLVNYNLVEVQKSFASYKKGYMWAEPDIDMAADYLLTLSKDKGLYEMIGANAKASVMRQYNQQKLQHQYQTFFRQHDII